jgi:hypothetical protein
LLALRDFFAGHFFTGAAILKCSSFLPALIAAANHRGFSPRPAQVSLRLSGLLFGRDRTAAALPKLYAGCTAIEAGHLRKLGFERPAFTGHF